MPVTEFGRAAALRAIRRVDVTDLRRRLVAAKTTFAVLADQTGLPWIDRTVIETQLLASAGVAELPQIEGLNGLLVRQQRLAEALGECCQRREAVLAELQLHPCATGSGRSGGGGNGSSASGSDGCSRAQHEAIAQLLRQHDDLTDEVIALVQRWRKALALPLPFLFRGENYLLVVGRQCTIGGVVSTAAAHLRATSRHASYYYSTPYDPVVAQLGVLERPQMRLLAAEHTTQLQMCEQQLSLAHMGMYTPVLRLALQPQKPLREQCVMLNNLKWKRQLIASYERALRGLGAVRPVLADGTTTSAAAQFMTMSRAALHLRYFRRWADWAARRCVRTRGVSALQTASANMLAQARFTTWLLRRNEAARRRAACALIFDRSRALVLRRCMQRWFVVRATGALRRGVRRAMFLRYFHALQYRVLRKQLRLQHRDRQLRALLVVSKLRPVQCAALRHVRDASTVHRPWLLLMRREEEQRVGVARDAHAALVVAAGVALEALHAAHRTDLLATFSAVFSGDIREMLLRSCEARERAARRDVVAQHAFGLAEHRDRLHALRLADVERSSVRCAMSMFCDTYEQFVHEHVELMCLSVLCVKREQLIAREARSRAGILRQLQNALQSA